MISLYTLITISHDVFNEVINLLQKHLIVFL